MLYDPAGYEWMVELLSDLIVLTEPSNPQARPSAEESRRHQAALSALATLRRQHADVAGRPHFGAARSSSAFGVPYDSSFDAYASITCTDPREDTRGSNYPAYSAKADSSAPYFGRIWTWSSSVCASDAFTGNDEDAYAGPFDVRTSAPLLFVGDYYDPATNYAGAVSASRRWPNSRLLSSNSWGHTAYGTSDCVSSKVDRYLLTGKLPARNTVSRGDIQPFESRREGLRANHALQKALRARLIPSPSGFHLTRSTKSRAQEGAGHAAGPLVPTIHALEP